MSTIPARGDFVCEETDDSTHTKQDPKDDGMVFVQPTLERPVAPLVPYVEDAKNPFAQEP